MGTLFTIKLYAAHETVARVGADAAFAKIAALDKMMTDYDPESELMQLCQRPVGEPTPVSAELFEVLQESQRVATLTEGAFDVTIGPLVRLWRRARRSAALPSPEQLARARESVGWQKLKLDSHSQTVTLTVPAMQLDLGGIAKGFAADKALAELRRMNLKRALVAASGDIAVGDPPPGENGWRVEIGSLGRTNDRPACVLRLENAAVSTSGDTEQFVEINGRRYSHIVDPLTGVGLTNRLQVTIVGARAMDTDAFATATTVLGPSRGLKLVESLTGAEALFVTPRDTELQVIPSKGFEHLPGQPDVKSLKEQGR